MSLRSVMISRPAKLRREHYSLAIEQDDTAFVPFEDIAVIVLNHREIVLTHPVLSACAEYGISLFATGDNHQPSGVFLPFLQHTRSTRLWRLQRDAARPLVKQTWAAIIRRKIANQAICLRLCGRDGTEPMESLARRVRSGDPDRLEAQAAALYFSRLFDAHFAQPAALGQCRPGLRLRRFARCHCARPGGARLAPQRWTVSRQRAKRLQPGR